MKEKKEKKDMEKEVSKKATKKRKFRLKRWVWIAFLAVFLGVGGFCTYHFIDWSKDNDDIKKQMEELEKVPVNEVPVNPDNEEIVNPPEEQTPEGNGDTPAKADDYWDYIKLPLMEVDVAKLKEKNSDTVAWLKVNGTNINYPVVQAADNDYYLNHAFNKTINDAGWVFMDYRNNVEDFDDNTIIYAHGRQNTTMFGSLKNIFKNNWYENTDNHVLHLSTETQNTLWQVISIYIIPEETYYLISEFGSTASKQKFLDTIMSRSQIDFGATVNTNDKILTLSTCYNHTNRVVLHAKLIKKAPAGQ